MTLSMEERAGSMYTNKQPTIQVLTEEIGLPRDKCIDDGKVLYCTVNENELAVMAVRLHEYPGCKLTSCLAYDNRFIDGFFHIAYVFDCFSHNKYIVLDTRVPSPAPVSNSLAQKLKCSACLWCEWEIRDLYGIEFREHPGRGRLVLPDTWPENVHPMRKDAPSIRIKTPPSAPVTRRGAGKAIVPVGPYHPALHEPEYFELVVDGERVVEARYRGFFVYRGIEKLAEERFTYDQVPFLAERICGICGFTHSCCYCQAVEKALGINVPERALYIRTLLLELERVHSHLLWMAIMFHTIGYEPGFMHLMFLREKVMDVAEKLTGNRKTYGMNLPGGVRRDIDPGKAQALLGGLEKQVKKALKLARSYLEVSEARSRIEEVGVLSRYDAKKHSALGPVARASGLGVDVRKDHPYAAYGLGVDVDVKVRDEGDVLARFLVRIDETEESMRIMREVLERMPGGEIITRDYEYKPMRRGLSATEAPRGEDIHFVITGLSSRLFRWKVRAPSYNNISILPIMLEGYTLADAPVIIASIDPCFSCTDRVIVVDRASGKKRRLREVIGE